MKSLMDLIKEQDEIIKDITNVRQSGPITIDNVQDVIEKYDQIDDINTEIKNMINTNWNSKFMCEAADWFGVKPIDDILQKNVELAKELPTPEKNVTPDIVEYLKDGEWKPIKIFGKTGIAHIVIGVSEYTTLSHIIYDAVRQYKYVFNYSEILIEINNNTKYMTFVTNLKNIGNPDYTYIVFGCDFDPPVSKSNVVDILPEDIRIDIESLGEEMVNDPKQYYDPMYLKTNGAWMIPFPRIHNTDDIEVKADETMSTPKKKHRLFISQPFTGFDDTVIMQQRAHLFDIYCAYKGYDKSDVELIENHLPDDPYDIDKNFSSQDKRDMYRFCRSVGMLGKATDIIFYGSFHNSKGCRLEYEICRNYNINSISQTELMRFCKNTSGFEHFVYELWTKPWSMTI